MAVSFSMKGISRFTSSTLGRILPKKSIAKTGREGSGKRSLLKRIPFFKKPSDVTIVDTSQLDLLALAESRVDLLKPQTNSSKIFCVEKPVREALSLEKVLHQFPKAANETDKAYEERVAFINRTLPLSRSSSTSSSLLSLLYGPDGLEKNEQHSRSSTVISKVSNVSCSSALTKPMLLEDAQDLSNDTLCLKAEHETPESDSSAVNIQKAAAKLDDLMEEIIDSTLTLQLEQSHSLSPEVYFKLSFADKINYWETFVEVEK